MHSKSQELTVHHHGKEERVLQAIPNQKAWTEIQDHVRGRGDDHTIFVYALNNYLVYGCTCKALERMTEFDPEVDASIREEFRHDVRRGTNTRAHQGST